MINTKRWLSGRELIDSWNITDFEIFDYLKKGLPAYTKVGKRVIDLDPLERKKLFDKETALDLAQLYEIRQFCQGYLVSISSETATMR
jgi:hypothetical protein